MLSAALAHVQKGLLESGLNQAQVKLRQTYEGQYRGAKPVAYLNHSQGRLERDGARHKPGEESSSRRLWELKAAVQLELHFMDERQHDEVLAAFLTWLYDHSFEIERTKYRLPDGPISASYTDEEGFLLGEFSVRLEIPYESAILRHFAHGPLEFNQELAAIEV